MTHDEYLKIFTDTIKAAFEHEGPDFGELMLAVYSLEGYPEHVKTAAYQELRSVFMKFGAMSRAAYDDESTWPRAKDVRSMIHLKESEVWKLVRRRKEDEWPDEL